MIRSRPAYRKSLVLVMVGGASLLLAACGGPSSPSAPAAPSNVVATPGPGYMTVSWEHDGKGVQSFEVYRTTTTSALQTQATTPIGTASSDARSFKDDGIVAGVGYDYSVVAKGDSGTSGAASPPGGTATLEPGIDLVVGTYANTGDQPGTVFGLYWFLTEAQAASVVGRAHLRGPAGWYDDEVLDFGPPPRLSGEPGFAWYGSFVPVISGVYQVTLEAGGETFTASMTVDASQELTAPENVVATVSANKVTNVSWTPPADSVSSWVAVYAGDYGDYATIGTTKTKDSSASLAAYELSPGPHFVAVVSTSLDVTADLPVKTGQFNAALGVSDPFTIPGAARCTDPASVVSIPDANLARAVRDALSKASGDLTCADMGTLTELDWSWPDGSEGIENLEGLQHAVNLEFLVVNGNLDLHSLAALEGLPNLRELQIAWTDVTQDDAPVLQSLPALEVLDAGGSMFNDFSFLADIPTLVDLRVCCTQLDAADFGFLADLDRLHWLDVSGNRLTADDLGPVAQLTGLYFIHLARNSIDDFSVLAGMSELGGVNLSELGISDLSAIPNLGQLGWVGLQDNNLTDIGALTTDHDHVELQGNYLDLTPGSAAMTKIEELQNAGVEVVYEPQRAGGACLAALATSSGEFHQVDVGGRYLDSDPGQVTNPATTLTLSELGIAAGDCIGLQATGTFSYSPQDNAELGLWAVAVFRDGTGTVPSGGGEAYGSSTCSGADNDIADDFQVSPFSALYLQVPVGATELLLAPDDCDGHNNTDADGDFGVVIRH